jgi:hypothetical protein
MTDLPPRSRPDPIADLRSERMDALARILSPGGPPDPAEQAPPTFLPSLGREEAVDEWGYLRGWVEALVGRFPHLCPDAIPLCWYRHPGHVEALSALSDFERACYGRSALPTGAVRWHRAFRDIEERLRAWTAAAGCNPADGHTEPKSALTVDEDDWARFVVSEVEHRPAADL